MRDCLELPNERSPFYKRPPPFEKRYSRASVFNTVVVLFGTNFVFRYTPKFVLIFFFERSVN